MCLTIACEAMCCAGSTFCSLACCCCQALVKSTLKEQVKLTYILLNYAVMAFTVIALYYIQDLYSNYLSYIGCPDGLQDICMGVSGIYRMSFVLAIFYFILGAIMELKGSFAKQVNEGLWLLKFIFIAVAFYGTLYIPNTFFEHYVNVSIVASGLFQLFQILIYIDIFYLWAEKWVTLYDQGVEAMGSALVAAASFTYIFAIILNIYNFIWFGQNYAINLINIGLIILLTVVQLFGFNPQGSLLASGCISCYITYMTFSALSSYPDSNVNVFYFSEQSMTAQMFVNGFLNFCALIYLIFATQENSKQTLRVLDKSAEKQHNPQTGPIEIEMSTSQQIAEARALIEQHDLAPYSSNQYVIFHIILIFCSMYMAMMITNWGSPNIKDNTQGMFQPSWLSYYVKLASSWICSLFYIWTLIAPKLFPDRFQQ